MMTMEIEKTENFNSNKIAVMNVLAGLISNPLLFNNENYKFDIHDFPTQFHQIVFGAVFYLVEQGLTKIDYIDIDQFLKQYPLQYSVFTKMNGAAYIQQILKIYDEGKFDYYYQSLKKFSLIDKIQKQGIDISNIYNTEEIDPAKIAQMQEDFDKMTVNEIINNVESRLISIKEQFASNSDMSESKSGTGIMELIDRLKETPEMGLAFQSKKLTTVYRGFRLGALYLESSSQGQGKSRRMVGESVRLAVPEYYDVNTNKWVQTGCCEKVLLISTELERDEQQTMWLAAISGVPEDHILDGNYTKNSNEEERVRKAGQLMIDFPIYFVSISNYDIDDIINIIKKYRQQEGVNYVFYDYLSTTIKIMAEGARKTRVSGLREDQILLMFITRLKDLAKNLQIAIWSSTQLSGDWKNTKDADQSLLRGAKSLSDKADCCSIMLPIRESDQEVVQTYAEKGFNIMPTHVWHIYKVRRGHYNNVRLYFNFDRSTCRVVDCFATDNAGNFLDITDTNIELVLDATKETDLKNAIGGITDDDLLDF